MGGLIFKVIYRRSRWGFTSSTLKVFSVTCTDHLQQSKETIYLTPTRADSMTTPFSFLQERDSARESRHGLAQAVQVQRGRTRLHPRPHIGPHIRESSATKGNGQVYFVNTINS